MNSLRVESLSPIFPFQRSMWRRIWLDGLKFRFVWVMAMSAEEVSSFALPHEVTGSLSVNPCPPVPVKVPMTFTAEPVAFGKVYQFSVIKAEFIPVFCIMTIEAPPHGFCMMYFDFCMFLFQLPFFPVYFHGSVTIAAGEDSLGKRRGRDRELLTDRPGRSG